MYFKNFEISNFKGIINTKINLDKAPIGNIYTLVGLNESGKTTILEAINYITSNDNTQGYSDLYDKANYSTIDSPFDLIPIGARGAFNGDISVKAEIAFEETDYQEIQKYASEKLNIQIDIPALKDSFIINKVSKFENSSHKTTTTYWTISLVIKEPNKRKYSSIDSKNNFWESLVTFIKSKIPPVLYFPTFLFDFPKRIYLEDSAIPDKQKRKINSYYKDTIQDILATVVANGSINSLILERLKSGDENQLKAVDSILLQMGNKISNEVFDSWNRIFDIKMSNKSIKINYSTDKALVDNTGFYVEIEIQDGDSIYNVAQRSLGFRWFFCFLLFTQFRSLREKSSLLFLFDEPASNLHSSAQKQLLNSFSKIAGMNTKIIYSTHSHYMINPSWLENTYIVENTNLKNNIDDISEYNSQNTNIIAHPYRDFVSKYPEKTQYFQPILDVLQYQPSALDNIPKVAMFEGKTDFYIIKYFENCILGNNTSSNILPGLGSGELKPLISLYLGWGRKFIIVLDSDNAGKKCQELYKNEFLLGDDVVFTLEDIDSTWKNSKIEDLISTNDKKLIDNNKKVNKKQIDRFFQSKLALNEKITFETETVHNFKKIIGFINLKL